MTYSALLEEKIAQHRFQHKELPQLGHIAVPLYEPAQPGNVVAVVVARWRDIRNEAHVEVDAITPAVPPLGRPQVAPQLMITIGSEPFFPPLQEVVSADERALWGSRLALRVRDYDLWWTSLVIQRPGAREVFAVGTGPFDALGAFEIAPKVSG